MNKHVTTDGTVGKALEVLDQVAEVGRPVRFYELLEESPHPKATLYRLLTALTNQGMLTYNQDMQTYWLGLKLVRLAHKAWDQASLASIASPILNSLAAITEETIHLAQMDSGQVLFVDKKRHSGYTETLAQIGRIAPAHCTGVGKALLAFLPETKLERAMKQQTFFLFTPNTLSSPQELELELVAVRKEGIAFDREEHEVGVISIAAPILRENGQPIGALSIASSTSRHCLESLLEFKPTILDAARRIAGEAEAWCFPQTN